MTIHQNNLGQVPEDQWNNSGVGDAGSGPGTGEPISFSTSTEGDESSQDTDVLTPIAGAIGALDAGLQDDIVPTDGNLAPVSGSFGSGSLSTFGAMASFVSQASEIMVQEVHQDNTFAGCTCPMCTGDTFGTGGVTPGDLAVPGPAGTLNTLATYLNERNSGSGGNDFWDEFWGGGADVSTPFWNLGTTGTNAQSGTITFNITGGNFFDSNGLATASRQEAIRNALDVYEDVLGINFVETTDFNADLVFGDFDPGRAYANFDRASDGSISRAWINIATNWSGNGTIGDYFFSTALHEIGHTLGLGHQGNYNAGNGNPTYGNQAVWANDTVQYSMMSYWAQGNYTSIPGETPSGAYLGEVNFIGPQIVDWLALDRIYNPQGYGIDDGATISNTTWGFNSTWFDSSTPPIENELNDAFASLSALLDTTTFCIVDGGGVDTLDLSGFSNNSRIDLRINFASSSTVYFSNVAGLTGNLSTSVGTVIENAVGGAGSETIYGNDYNNVITTGDGNNYVSSYNGFDSVYAGINNDTVYGGANDDTVFGYAGTDNIYGDSGNDYLKGGAGSDYIYAGSGVDTIYGEDGNDLTTVTLSTTLSGAYYDGGGDSDTFEVSGAGTFDLRNTGFARWETLRFVADGTDSDKSMYLTGAQVNSLGAVMIDGNNNSGSDDAIYIYLADSATTSINLENWSFVDWVQGGTNSDFLGIYGGAAGENVRGSYINDYMYLDEGTNVAYGNEGNDTIKGGGGTDFFYGGADNDLLKGGAGSDFLYSGDGADTLNGNDGSDYLYDTLASSGHSVNGDEGADYLYKSGIASAGTVGAWNGGTETDALVWLTSGATAADVVNLATGFITNNGTNYDSLTDIEDVYVYNGAGIIGSAVGNYLYASGIYDNAISGGDGNDTIQGGEGNDALLGQGDVDVLYGGAGNDTLTGGLFKDTSYGDEGNDLFRITDFDFADDVYGGADTDTLDLSASANTAIAYNVNEITQTYTYMPNNFGSDGTYVMQGIERYIGSNFADMMTSNGNASTFYGGLGNDTLVSSGNGGETMYGGDGVDLIDHSDFDGAYVFDMASGLTNYSNELYQGFEYAVMGDGNDNVTGAGGNETIVSGLGNDILNAAAGNDLLVAGAGNDTLTGGTGIDVLEGGTDNDWYFVDNAADIIVENAAAGTADRVLSSVNFVLAADDDVELLTTNLAAGTGAIKLTGNDLAQGVTGNAGNNVLSGLGGNDSIVGSAGNDTLDGGTGIDVLTGGADSDWYYVDNAADVVNEAAGGGTADRVLASVNFVLAADDDIELLTTTLAAGTGAIKLTGNDLAQGLTGNAGNNVLSGLGGNDSIVGSAGNDTLDGGTGNDVLTGGADNDWYYVDNAGDVVNEVAGGGTADRVLASVNYVLAADDDIELLTTNLASGTAAIKLTGNGLSQSISGNAGNNVLSGLAGNDTLGGADGDDTLDGGTGNDALVGGAGNDWFYVDNAADTVTEAVGGGTADRVLASVNYVLGAAANVELLTTTSAAGTTSVNLTGNALAQGLTGNAGANVLNGGLGNDTIVGNAGSDTFVFSTALGATNVDFLADFNVAADTINLSAAIFGLPAGVLNAAAFVANAAGAAADASDRIIYETDTGNLRFDADGNGIGASVLFADLASGLAMTAADFFVF